MAITDNDPSTGFRRICAMYQSTLPCNIVQCNKVRSTLLDTTEEVRGEAGILRIFIDPCLRQDKAIEREELLGKDEVFIVAAAHTAVGDLGFGLPGISARRRRNGFEKNELICKS